MGSWPNLGVLLRMAVSLLLRGVGFYPLSSIVEVVCPFFMKESFVLGLSGLSFCIFLDIKRIHGVCGVYLLWGWGNTFLFVRKNVTVPGFYLSKKTGTSSSSMDCDSPVQTPATSNHQRSSKLGNGKAIDTSEILSNACPGVTPINDPLREATPIDSDVINGINSHSVGPDIKGECNGCTEDVNAKTATHGSVCNARSGINIHNLGPDCTHERNSGLNMEVNAVVNKGSKSVSKLGSNSLITQPSYCVINQDLLPKSVSVQQTVESDKQSNEIDAELSKFDMQNSPAVNTLRLESRASKFSRPESSWA